MVAMSGPEFATFCWDTENDIFSIWIVEGMADRRADKSECGLVVGYRVGSAWIAGIIACVCSCSSLSGAWGAGRARGALISSISVSLEGAVRCLGVFLVDTTIVLRRTIVRQKRGNKEK